MKILIVDDNPSNLKIIGSYCKKWGYSIITGKNGEEAVTHFQSENPDLVLMDVMMPIMDGFEATTRIKEISRSRWVPIILLTSLDEGENIVKGVKAGADDYLKSPVNFTILRGKIKVMERIFHMQNDLHGYVKELEFSREQDNEEMHHAKRVMDKILRSNDLHENILSKWILPAKGFSGDVITSSRVPNNSLYVMLADAVGHGLPAALIMVPILQTFYSMSEKGYSLINIIEELNYQIHTEMPTGCFVAASFASVNPKTNCIEIWNGGNPPMFLINRSREVTQKWKSTHLPLGFLNREDFNVDTERFYFTETCQLMFFSDGLIEAEGRDGEFFGYDKFLQCVQKFPPHKRFNSLIEELKKYIGPRSSRDDISLVSINCKPEKGVQNNGINAQSRDYWELEFLWGTEKLKSYDLVQLVLESLNMMGIRKNRNGPLFTVISELLNNALDHGILQMDSSLKNTPNGFEEYKKERDKRRSALKKGQIDFRVIHTRVNGKKVLRFEVKDSGKGFPYQEVMHTADNHPHQPFNFGIPLLKKLCSDLQYLGDGNEVYVDYPL